MRKNAWLVILVFALMMVVISGCSANKEALKEERVAPMAAATVAPEAKPVEKAAPVEKAPAVKGFSVGEPVLEGSAKAAPAATAVAVPARELYELADIRFDFDKFNLKDEARATLKNHAEWLNKNKDVMVVVEGHCDERGTAEYNLALGERRANAATKFLVDMGIDAKRIKTLSYGEELPLDKGHTEDAWARNRRAHFDASGKK